MGLGVGIENSEHKSEYDAYAKNLLKNKQILARILKECVNEFKQKSIPEIIDDLENNATFPDDRVPVNPGATNNIVAEEQEDAVAGEDKVYFDIVFTATATGTNPVKVRINLEAQRKYRPGYDLVSRAVFYCARLLSSQAGTVLSLANHEYDKLEKVYSIWICMDVPKKDANSISTYHMMHKSLHGSAGSDAKYDLLEVVMIRLGKDDDNELINVLRTLLTNELNASQKAETLQDYGIQLTDGMRKEIDTMCNLSDGIEEKAEARGAKRATLQTVHNLMQSFPNMSDDDILKLVDHQISCDDIKQIRKELRN